MQESAPSRGAVAWISFAGFMMILGGGLGILQGLAWVINSDNFPGEDQLLSQNVTTWGWIQVLVGAVVLLAGLAVFSGNVLARTVGVIAAIVSAYTAFVSMTFYPLWGVVVILADIAIIWALTAHGRDIQKARDMGAM